MCLSYVKRVATAKLSQVVFGRIPKSTKCLNLRYFEKFSASYFNFEQLFVELPD